MTNNSDSDQRTMPQDQVKAIFREVQTGMTERVKASLSELYFPNLKNPELMENGTGAFVEVEGKKLLLSNDHVIANKGLHHSFYGSDRFINAGAVRYGMAAPIDAGAVIVPEGIWEKHSSQALAISFNSFADKHETVTHEILWTAGYPGARVRQLSNMTLSVCQALPTQEKLFDEGEVPAPEFNDTYHFAVGYSPGGAQRLDTSGPSNSPGLSDPHGLSGSLVWNTRRLECYYNQQIWDPSLAVVTGIIWGWPKSDYLIATKVEHFRQFLVDVAKQV